MTTSHMSKGRAPVHDEPARRGCGCGSGYVAAAGCGARGRLVVFFPGQYEQNNYRLLDARDGWNYMAVPISLHSAGGAA